MVALKIEDIENRTGSSINCSLWKKADNSVESHGDMEVLGNPVKQVAGSWQETKIVHSWKVGRETMPVNFAIYLFQIGICFVPNYHGLFLYGILDIIQIVS